MAIPRSRSVRGHRVLMIPAATALAIGLAVAVSPPVVATPTAAVTAATVDAGPFTVDGLLGTAAATVAVTITSPDDVGGCSSGYPDTLVGDDHVVATMSRTSGGPAESALVYLNLTSGTLASGTWSAPWNIGATRGGTWVLSKVTWCYGLEEFRVAIDPRAHGITRTLSVVGTHVPRVTSFRTPAIATFGARQSITFTFYGSNNNLLRSRPTTVGMGEYGSCGTFLNGNTMIATNAAGQLTMKATGFDCVYFANPQRAVLGTFADSTLLAFRWASRYEYYAGVSAVRSASLATRAQPVVITGSVRPASGTVLLQQRGSTAWRTVASAPVRTSGRYTLAMPYAAGCQNYRVVASLTGRYAPTASATFVVTGR